MPNFCFTVLKKDEQLFEGKNVNIKKLTEITIVEIPHQEMFTVRPVFKNQVVYIDLNTSNETYQENLEEFQKAFPSQDVIKFCHTDSADMGVCHI